MLASEPGAVNGSGGAALADGSGGYYEGAGPHS